MRGEIAGKNLLSERGTFSSQNHHESHQQQSIQCPHVVWVVGDCLAVVGLGQLYIFKATLCVADFSVSVG